MTCEHYGNLVVCRGPAMVEYRRKPWQTHWCFRCRKRLPHDAVLYAQDLEVEPEPSYMGEPYWAVECHGCGEDHVHFPGCEPDGPTLEAVYG